jgi:hypothetical protein
MGTAMGMGEAMGVTDMVTEDMGVAMGATDMATEGMAEVTEATDMAMVDMGVMDMVVVSVNLFFQFANQLPINLYK